MCFLRQSATATQIARLIFWAGFPIERRNCVNEMLSLWSTCEVRGASGVWTGQVYSYIHSGYRCCAYVPSCGTEMPFSVPRGAWAASYSRCDKVQHHDSGRDCWGCSRGACAAAVEASHAKLSRPPVSMPVPSADTSRMHVRVCTPVCRKAQLRKLQPRRAQAPRKPTHHQLAGGQKHEPGPPMRA